MSNRFTKVLGLIALTGLSTYMDAQVAAANLKWAPAGPIFNAGRSRNLVVDRADPSGKTLYTGSASSGVFISTNGGLFWKPLHDKGKVKNISYMAQGLDNAIYAATGEGFLRAGQAAKAKPGTGLYKLVDDTLMQMQSSSAVGTIINRIACRHTGNIDVIAIAGNKGILVSNSGPGGPFLPVNGPSTSSVNVGMDVKFDDAGVLYFTIGNEKSFAGSPSSKIWKSLPPYGSAIDITPTSIVLGTPKYGRIELAVAPSNNNVIYASIANKAVPDATLPDPVGNSSSLNGLFVSYDAGVTWALLLQGAPQLDPLTNGAQISSGDYSQVVMVHPTNPNILFMGGYRFYLFQRTGGSDSNPIGSWLQLGIQFYNFIPFYLHENIHDIKMIGTGTTAKIYFVTDAGIYRSVDLAGGTTASFQPFYGGLVTGQFNSVSISSFPGGAHNVKDSINNQTQTVANDGYIGGTGGNGLTYFDGNYPLANQETSYLGGEVYNSELSKILPNAAFFTGGTGKLYRISDVRNGAPDLIDVNSYTGALSKLTPVSNPFANEAANPAGTPFKLWENYGQAAKSPDSLVFYNDTIRVQTSIQPGGVPSLTTQTTFTFSTGRPNKFALIDSIAIRTGTALIEVPDKPAPPAFQTIDKKDIFIKLAAGYTVSTTLTTPPISLKTGPVAAAGVTLNATNGLDEIAVTFTSPPFLSKTTASFTGVSDPSVYYKVFATVFYKYAKGDTIQLTDNSISTKPQKYILTLPQPLRWSLLGANGPKPISAPTNQVQKIPTRISARLAYVYSSKFVTGGVPAIVVSKAPLNLNDRLDPVRVSQSGCLTTDANGVATNSIINIPGKAIVMEWSKRGTELFYATDSNRLYRVSFLGTIMDNSPTSYSGKLSTDIFKYNGVTPYVPTTASSSLNPNSPYRTTLLGTFTKTITSISIDKDDQGILLTFDDPTGTLVRYSNTNIMKSDYSNINFTTRTGNLTNLATYCSLILKDSATVSKQVMIGTDNGIFFTPDITVAAPTWTNVNNDFSVSKPGLPNVQIFDLKQQTLDRWNCYNSGQIYVATNGRGVWTNKDYNKPFIVSVNEIQNDIAKENNLTIYPNPTNGNVYVSFNTSDTETGRINVMDINGRLVKSEDLGKLYPGQVNFVFDTAELSSGMYIVSISGSSGIKRVAKLIVTK